MATSIKANGETIRQMGEEVMYTTMAKFTKACGRMISSTGLAQKCGEMAQDMKVTTSVGASRERESLAGLTVPCTTVTFITMTFRAMVGTRGRTAAFTKANGTQTRCMVRESSATLMDVVTRAII